MRSRRTLRGDGRAGHGGGPDRGAVHPRGGQRGRAGAGGRAGRRAGTRCGSASGFIPTRPGRWARTVRGRARGRPGGRSTSSRRRGRSARSASTTTTISRRATCSGRSSPPRSALAVARRSAGRHPRARGRRGRPWPCCGTRVRDACAGVMHCFTGTAAFARRALDLGLHHLAGRHRHVPEGRRAARRGGASCRPTGCSSRPTARFWPRSPIAGSGTSRPGSQGWRSASPRCGVCPPSDAGGADREHLRGAVSGRERQVVRSGTP